MRYTQEVEYYTTRPARYDNGTFFFTQTCNNRMYSVSNANRYDGAYCPKCGRILKRLKSGNDFEVETEKE